MPDNTCFKLIIADPAWNDIREVLKPFGLLCQVYIPKETPNIVLVKYKQERSALNARIVLSIDPRVMSIEPMEEWPFETRKPTQQSARTGQANSSAENISLEPLLNINVPVPHGMQCSKCRSMYAELVCSVCAAWYCNEHCQLLDWPNHRMNCLPRLVRGFPVLQSLQSIANQNQQRQQHIPQQFHPQQQHTRNGQLEAMNGRSQQKQSNVATTTTNRSAGPAPSGSGIQKKATENLQPKKPNELVKRGKVKEVGISAQNRNNEEVAKLSEISEKPRIANLQTQKRNNGDEEKSAAQQEKKHLSPDKSNILPLKNVKPKLPGKPDDQQFMDAAPIERVMSNMPLDEPNKVALQGTPPKAVVHPEPHAASLPSTLMKTMQKEGTKRTIPYGPFPAVGSLISISYVTERMLFIHETSQDGSDPFMSLLIRCMHCVGETKHHLERPPAEGDIIFAPFDENFYRAIVKKVEGDNVLVLYPDFGNTQSLHWKLMKEISDDTVKYATCHTHGVSLFFGKPFTPAAHSFLTGLIEDHRFELVQVESHPGSRVKSVQLRHCESKYVLNDKVRELAAKELSDQVQRSDASATAKTKSLVPPDPATYKPVFGSEFTDPAIPQGDNEAVELTIVESSEFTDSQLVSAIVTADQPGFVTLLKECEDYGQLDPNQYLGEAEPNYACLVQYECTWSRALKLSADTDDQYYLLDLGIIRELKKSCPVRRYPPALSRKLYCSEYVVDNPEMCTKGKEGGENCSEWLPGKTVKAKLHIEEATEQFHMHITSITV